MDYLNMSSMRRAKKKAGADSHLWESAPAFFFGPMDYLNMSSMRRAKKNQLTFDEVVGISNRTLRLPQPIVAFF
jgi:hypothetical protein